MKEYRTAYSEHSVLKDSSFPVAVYKAVLNFVYNFKFYTLRLVRIYNLNNVTRNVFTNLLWHWEFWEVWDVSGPLDGAEEQTGSQLTDAVDAHDRSSSCSCLHLCLVVGGPVPVAGVRLSPEELGDELWNRLAVEIFRPHVTSPCTSDPTCQGVWTDTWVRGWDPTPLDSYRRERGEANGCEWYAVTEK